MKYLFFHNAYLDDNCKLVAQEQRIDLNNVICESIQLSKTLFQNSTTTSFGKTCFTWDILFESSPNNNLTSLLSIQNQKIEAQMENKKRGPNGELNNNLKKRK